MKKIILTTSLSLGLMLGLTSCFGEDQTPKYKESKIEVENTYSILKVYPENELPKDGIVDLKRITEVDAEVFAGYKGLKQITGKRLQKIGPKAFAGSGLLKLTLGEAIPVIAEDAFAETSEEKELFVPEGKEEQYYLLAHTHHFISINGVKIPQITVTEGVLTLYPAYLLQEEITLPKEATTIGKEVFASQEVLKKVHAPSITKIEAGAFKGATELVEVELGATIPEVAEDAFADTPMSKALIVPEEKAAEYIEFAKTHQFSTINGKDVYPLPEGITIEGNVLTKISGSVSIEKLELPPYVTVIKINAFNNRPRIKEIIGTGVVEIQEKGMAGARQTTTAIFPKLKKIGRSGLEGFSALVKFEAPLLEEIGVGAFKKASSLKEINFPLLKEVPVDAFNARWDGQLTTVILPSVTKIDDNGFGYQVNIKLLELGKTPPTVTPQGFSDDLKGKNPRLVVPADAVEAYGGVGNKWHKDIFVVEAKK